MKDVQEERPKRFGPNGKMSSAYSLTNFTWNLGIFLGPIISGSLTRTVGYSYMNMVIGTSHPLNSSFPAIPLLETELRPGDWARNADFLMYISYVVLYCWDSVLGVPEEKTTFVRK